MTDNVEAGWQRTESRNVIRRGEWSIVKWSWGTYCLWQRDKFIGRFDSADKAKEMAK